jgi:hypothetical protein
MQAIKITGTRAAFIHVLNIRGVYKTLDVSSSTISNWKRALKEDLPGTRNIPTLDTMERLLEKYGATVVQEKVWKLTESE